MSLRSLLFKFKILRTRIYRKIADIIGRVLVVLSFFLLGLIVYDIGFKVDDSFAFKISLFFIATLALFGLRSLILLLKGQQTFAGVKSKWMDRALTFSLIFITLYHCYIAFHSNPHYAFISSIIDRIIVYSFASIYAMSEISGSISRLMRTKFNPAPLFAISFFLLISGGTGLLLLPNSTLNPISFVDALFTATSAVCITGLSTVDVGTTFSQSGQLIIMLLIQIGGLGVITFTSFLGLILMGKTSLSHDLMIKDVWSHDVLGEVIKILRNIILTTFTLEFIGAFFIYRTINGDSIDDIQFSLFHAVSAFCNAGFSTVSDGLYNSALRENYSLHFTMAILIIIGGIGFPILSNFYKYFRHYLDNLFHLVVNRRAFLHSPNIMTINSKLALTTTFLLLSVGTLYFFFSEYHFSMEGRTVGGKVVSSFFMAVAPRTAGFNTVDMGLLSNGTILLTLLFMWIGGSPMSTGGGIKTTTFAIALLSLYSTLRGRGHIEVYNREVSKESVQRAFALMMATFILLFISITLLSRFEYQASLTQIVFECFSALSTTGLSLNFTTTLTSNSKIVLIILMFIGRVGVVTILSLLVKRVISTHYSYPKTNILIG